MDQKFRKNVHLSKCEHRNGFLPFKIIGNIHVPQNMKKVMAFNYRYAKLR